MRTSKCLAIIEAAQTTVSDMRFIHKFLFTPSGSEGARALNSCCDFNLRSWAS